MLDLHYDDQYDILYIGIADKRNSVGCEEHDGMIVLRDLLTNEVTGLTITSFTTR